MAPKRDFTPRPASGALTKTGGFLRGFTHTLQPYIGCTFGCEYCYVKGLSLHRFHQPNQPWGAYAHPRIGIADKLQRELSRFAKRGELGQLAIFMSSSTDPYQGLERKWRLSRACLERFIDHPPGLLIVQTRSPLVRDDLDRLAALGQPCWLNFTLETDLDDVRQKLTPYCPSVQQRLQLLQDAARRGVQVQITVSPCLPYSDIETFGRILLDHGERIVVDSYVSGDGLGGRRTAATSIPNRYQALSWGEWRDEESARALYDWLFARIGHNAGWSQAGFAALTERTRHNGQPP